MGIMQWIGQGIRFLQPKAMNFLKNGATRGASWALNHANNYIQQKTPFGDLIKTVGPAAADWAGKQSFMDNMKQFGDTMENTTVGKKIQFATGINAGEAYKRGIDGFLGFLKNGGVGTVPSGQVSNAPAGDLLPNVAGDVNSVEKMRLD